MRLVKLAVASLSPTVGAVRSNTAALVAAARRMADDGRHARRVSRTGRRRLPARGPGAVAGLPRRPAARPRDRSPARPPTPAPCSCSAWPCAVQAQLFNAAAVVHRGRILGWCPRRSCRPTTSSTRRGRSRAAGPGWRSTPTACRSATTCSASTSAPSPSRSAKTPGRPTARCDGAASRAPRSSSTSRRRPTGWASTAPAARCWRRAPPTTRRCSSTPTPWAPRTGSSTTAAASSSRTAGWSTRRRASSRAPPAAVVDLDRTRRLRMEHTTWRADCETFVLRERPVPVHPQRRPRPPTPTGLPYPAPPGGSFFLPAPSPPAVDARDARARRAVRGAGPRRGELLRQDRRPSGRSAWRSRAAATRC